MAEDLITLEAYKEYVGIKNPDKDPRRVLLITLVSKLVKSYSARTFIDYVTETKIETFDARTAEVVLSEFPIISITSVKTSIDGGITQITLTQDDSTGAGFFADLRNCKVLTQVEDQQFLDTVNHPYRSLEVEYNAGYTEDGFGVTAEVPLDLRLALFDLVSYYENNEKTISKQMAAASIDNPTSINTNDFPPHIKRILDLYRIIDL